MINSIDFSSIQRVLVIKLRHHGDVLLTSPVFSALKQAHPHLQLDALVYLETRDMLTEHPDINEVITIDKDWKNLGLGQHLNKEISLIQKLKSTRYDLIIHLTESWRGMVLCRWLKPRFSVARKYYRRKSRLWLNSFSHNYPTPHSPRHTVDVHLDALRHIGVNLNDLDTRLLIRPGTEAENSLKEKLANHSISGNFIHIHPTSRWMFKSWSAGKFADLINRLQQDGHKIILSAAPDEKELARIKDIKQQLDSPIVDLSGKLTLKELVALISQAQLFIGVDSVPMHIAAAVNTPSVVMFGPSNEKLWGPWQSPSSVITLNQFLCRPCNLDGCAGSKISDCLINIPVEQVYQAAKKFMQ